MTQGKRHPARIRREQTDRALQFIANSGFLLHGREIYGLPTRQFAIGYLRALLREQLSLRPATMNRTLREEATNILFAYDVNNIGPF